MSTKKKWAIGLLIFQGLSLLGNIIEKKGLSIPNFAYFIGFFLPAIIACVLFYLDYKDQTQEIKIDNFSLNVKSLFLENFNLIENSNSETLNNNIFTKLEYLIFIYYKYKQIIYEKTKNLKRINYFSNCFITTIDLYILSKIDNNLFDTFHSMIEDRNSKYNIIFKTNEEEMLPQFLNYIANDYNNDPLSNNHYILGITKTLSLSQNVTRLFQSSINLFEKYANSLINENIPDISPLLKSEELPLAYTEKLNSEVKQIIDSFFIKLSVLSGVPQNKMNKTKIINLYIDITKNTPSNQNLDTTPIWNILKEENKLKEIKVLDFSKESKEYKFFNDFMTMNIDNLSSLNDNFKFSQKEIQIAKTIIAEYIDNFIYNDFSDFDIKSITCICFYSVLQNTRTKNYLTKTLTSDKFNNLNNAAKIFISHLKDSINKELSINSELFIEAMNNFLTEIDELYA